MFVSSLPACWQAFDTGKGLDGSRWRVAKARGPCMQLAGAAPSVVLAGPVFAGLVYASGSDVAANVGTFTQVTIAD